MLYRWIVKIYETKASFKRQDRNRMSMDGETFSLDDSALSEI